MDIAGPLILGVIVVLLVFANIHALVVMINEDTTVTELFEDYKELNVGELCLVFTLLPAVFLLSLRSIFKWKPFKDKNNE